MHIQLIERHVNAVGSNKKRMRSAWPGASSLFFAYAGLSHNIPELFLELLTGPEDRDAMRGNGAGVTCLRIPCLLAALPGAYFECTEATELSGLSFLQRIADLDKEFVDNLVDYRWLDINLPLYAVYDFRFR